MSTIFGVPVDAAYYIVSTLAAALTPLTGARWPRAAWHRSSRRCVSGTAATRTA